MSDRGQPVKPVPEGAPPPTEPVLRERAAPFEDAYHSKRATLREDEDEVLSGSMSAGRASDLLGQLDRLMSEYRSLPADDAELMKWRHRIERHDRLQDEIDAISDHLGVESPLDRGPAGVEYQGPGPSTLEEYYEEREKPGSEYRLGETLLPEADPDPLVEGMADRERLRRARERQGGAPMVNFYFRGKEKVGDFLSDYSPSDLYFQGKEKVSDFLSGVADDQRTGTGKVGVAPKLAQEAPPGKEF